MNILLIFFALPIATIIISIALQKILKCPILVAAIIFAIFLVVTFIVGNLNFLVAAIIYAIISFITAVLTHIICRILNTYRENSCCRDRDNCNCNCNNTRNNLLTISSSCSNNRNGDLLTISSNGCNGNTNDLLTISSNNNGNNSGSNSGSNGGSSGGGISNPSTSGFIYPVPTGYTTITTGMYYSSGSYHGAVDFGTGGISGQPVYAVADGVVITAKALTTSYGNYIIIMHRDGLYTLYAHGQAGSIAVSEGQYVKQGQQIMRVGNTGNSSGPHLHFEVRTGNGLYSNRVDPRPYLP